MLTARLIAILLLCGLLSSAAEGAAVRLRHSRLEARLIVDVGDGRLDQFEPLEAALVAGGVTDAAELQRCCCAFRKRCGLDDGLPAGSPELAAALFRVLHQRLLTGEYHVEYSSPRQAVIEGHFNCVSATILYYCLCEQEGLTPAVMATREHVFIRLAASSLEDVESTCPDWFERPASERVRSLQPAAAGAREINFVQLIGKVFYNRALVCLGESQFEEAVQLLEVSTRLDPEDVPARENLLASYNNWALALAEAGRFRQAAGILSRGRTVNPQYPPFAANDLHIHQQWVLQLCQQDRYSEAVELLDAAYHRRGDVALFDQGRLAVYQQWAESLLHENAPEQAFQVLQIGRQRHAEDRRWRDYEAAVLHCAEQLGLDADRGALP